MRKTRFTDHVPFPLSFNPRRASFKRRLPPVLRAAEALQRPVLVEVDASRRQGVFVPVTKPTPNACVMSLRVGSRATGHTIAVLPGKGDSVQVCLGPDHSDLMVMMFVLQIFEGENTEELPDCEIIATLAPTVPADPAATGGYLL